MFKVNGCLVFGKKVCADRSKNVVFRQHTAVVRTPCVHGVWTLVDLERCATNVTLIPPKGASEFVNVLLSFPDGLV